MNQPPNGFDRDATQPILVTPIAPPPARPAQQQATAFAPRFNPLGFYLIARLLAVAIDIPGIAFAVAAFGFHAFEVGFVALAGRDEGGFATLVTISFGVAIVFALLCESLFGTTLGKAIFGLRVRRTDGGHAGIWRIFVRYFLRPLDVLAIGPLLALVTPRHQRLGDFAGGTVVSFSRIGPLASVVSIALLAGLVYAEVAFGGGVESALGVSAEATSYGPDLIGKTAALIGLALPRPAHVNAPAFATTPSPAPSVVPTDAPSLAPTDVPAVAPSDAPAAVSTDAPTASPTDASTDEPTDAPSAEHI